MVRAPGESGSVFLLTDYGYADEFAGVLRAVISRLAPPAPIIDLSHDVAPFDVRAGALLLARTVVHLGPGVVVAVVDPGVGTSRRAVAVEVGGPDAASAGPEGPEGPRYFVGPDNGLLGFALDAQGGARSAVTLPAHPIPGRGATFDGRDVFAPAAARLWGGEALEALGSPLDVDDLVRLAPPVVSIGPGGIDTEVLWVDRFGNVQLAVSGDAVAADIQVMVLRTGGGTAADSGPHTVDVRRVDSFAALQGDEIGVVVDSNGKLSVVCNQRSAATVLAVKAGDPISLDWAGTLPP